jgi:hypothetical protein
MRDTDVTYMVECYWPDVTEERAGAAAARARAAASALAAEGTDVRYAGSILVPEDEVVFFLFESDSTDAVRAASELAELPFERVVLSRERR